MTVQTDLDPILSALDLEAENPGAFDGQWLPTSGERVESLNPATGEPIAAVNLATAADYERTARAAVEAFAIWRTWPAPRPDDRWDHNLRSTRERRRTHRVSRRPTCTSPAGPFRVIATARCPCR